MCTVLGLLPSCMCPSTCSLGATTRLQQPPVVAYGQLWLVPVEVLSRKAGNGLSTAGIQHQHLHDTLGAGGADTHQTLCRYGCVGSDTASNTHKHKDSWHMWGRLSTPFVWLYAKDGCVCVRCLTCWYSASACACCPTASWMCAWPSSRLMSAGCLPAAWLNSCRAARG